MSKSDVEAGKSFVRLYLKDEVTRQIRKAMTTVGTTVAAAGGAITAAMGASLKIFASTGDQLDKMSQRTGIAAGQLAAYGFAAEQSGSNLETFETSIRRTQQAIGDLNRGVPMMTANFASLGLSVRDLAGLSPDKQFDLIAERIGAIEDPTQRAAAAVRIFGRAGTSMLPMLGNLKALKEEARNLGIIPSEEEVKRAAEVTDAINRVKRVAMQMFFDVGAAISGDVLGALESAKNAGVVWGQWIRENKEIIVTVAKVGVTLLALGTTLVTVAKAWGAASAAAALMYANPVLLGIAALAAGIALVTIALNRSKVAAEAKVRALRQAADAAKAEHEAGKMMRTEDIDRMKRLETLQGLQERFGSLTAEQTAEASGLIATLTGRYGDLGITLDETTGQLSGVTGAMQGMVDVMREMAAIEVGNQVKAMQKELYGIDEQITLLKEKQKQSGGFDEAWGAADWQQELTAAQEKRLELTRQLIDVQESLNRISGGSNEATAHGMEPDASPAGGGTTATEDEQLKFAERVAQRRAQIELDRIDNQERKELEAINRRYQEERAEAQRLEMDLTALAETTELEKFRVREKYAKQRAEEDEKRLQDAVEAERRRAEEIGQLKQDLEQRVARQEIEAKFADDPNATDAQRQETAEAKRRALIEFEHKLEMEAIAARKGITEEEKATLQALAERSRDLRLAEEKPAAVEQQQQQDQRREQKEQQVTTHSAAAAQAAGFGGTREDLMLDRRKALIELQYRREMEAIAARRNLTEPARQRLERAAGDARLLALEKLAPKLQSERAVAERAPVERKPAIAAVPLDSATPKADALPIEKQGQSPQWTEAIKAPVAQFASALMRLLPAKQPAPKDPASEVAVAEPPIRERLTTERFDKETVKSKEIFEKETFRVSTVSATEIRTAVPVVAEKSPGGDGTGQAIAATVSELRAIKDEQAETVNVCKLQLRAIQQLLTSHERFTTAMQYG